MFENKQSVSFVNYNFLAGLPAYLPGSVISFVTTAPAPITTSEQIDTGKIVAFDPIETWFEMIVDFHKELSPLAGPPFEKLSFTNITP